MPVHKKSVDKINKIMEKSLKLRTFEHTNFKKYIIYLFFLKSNFEEMKIHFFKKKTALKNGQSLIQKISFTHGLIFFWKIHFETIQF